MATTRKSFLLYADLIDTIKKLPDAKAGNLMKIILEYVNDMNPKVNDKMVDVVFEPIKNQLKRDMIRYEEFKQKQARNGKKGGRPKKKETQKKPKNPSLNLETQKSLINNIIDNNNIIEEEQSSSTLFSINDFSKEISIRASDGFTLLLTRKTGRTVEQLIALVDEFLIEQRAKSKLSWPNVPDAKQHFINWVCKQPNSKSINIYATGAAN